MTPGGEVEPTSSAPGCGGELKTEDNCELKSSASAATSARTVGRALGWTSQTARRDRELTGQSHANEDVRHTEIERSGEHGKPTRPGVYGAERTRSGKSNIDPLHAQYSAALHVDLPRLVW